MKDGRIFLYEALIKNRARTPVVGVENLFHNSFKQSHVAINANLQENIGELGSTSEPGPDFLRVFEARQARFGQRIDVHDFAAAPFRMQQRSEHPRMVRSWILADLKNRVRQITGSD